MKPIRNIASAIAITGAFMTAAGGGTVSASPREATISFDGLAANAVPDAETTAKAFHAALEKGDRAAVLALLSPEVAISEGGHTQTRDQYAASHLDEDIAFLKYAKIKPVFLGSMAMGEAAMVGSRSEVRARHKGKPIVTTSNEMLDLKKTPEGWRITRIQWTSERLSK